MIYEDGVGSDVGLVSFPGERTLERRGGFLFPFYKKSDGIELTSLFVLHMLSTGVLRT